MKNLFSGKQGESSQSRKPDPGTVIASACDRNIPICVVRPRQAGRVPMARGRMLSRADDTIEIDRVQIPGLELHFSKGDDLQCYFSIGQTLYQFRTKLLTICEPKRLNARMLIPGMSIAMPGSISKGDRRNIYRVSVAARADRPTVSAWRLIQPTPRQLGSEEAELENAEMPTMPSGAFNPHGLSLEKVASKLEAGPDYSGWVVDATENGLGIRLETIRAARFDIFEPILIRVTIPAEAACVADDGTDLHDLAFIAEVRSKREIGDDGCRLGIVLLDEHDVQHMRQKRNVLRKYLADIQREHLRNTRERAG